MVVPRQEIGIAVMDLTRRAARAPRAGLSEGSAGRVGDEDGLAGLDRAPQLGIAVEVHHVVPDARILVARHQAHPAPAPLGEEDRAAVETEGLAQPQRDGLHDVREVQRAADLLQDLDDGQQVLPLLLQRVEPVLQPFDFVECGNRSHWGIRSGMVMAHI